MFTCLADGVMPIWTTMMARVMFSSCILWQYILMVLIPTFGSSEKDKKKMAYVISYVCIATQLIISIQNLRVNTGRIFSSKTICVFF